MLSMINLTCYFFVFNEVCFFVNFPNGLAVLVLVFKWGEREINHYNSNCMTHFIMPS